MMGYMHVPPPGSSDYTGTVSFAAVGFPRAWVTDYRQRFVRRIDPNVRLAMSGARPVWWSQARRATGLSRQEIDFLDEMEAAGLGDGITVPVFGLNGRSGCVALGFGSMQPDWSAEQVARLAIAAQLGHEAYCRIFATRYPDDATLSQRQSEILGWIARGKSNAAIGGIIGISPNTVDTYVRRIFEKLGVADRVTASLRGVALGLID